MVYNTSFPKQHQSITIFLFLLSKQIIFRKVADLKHEQELDEMQQNQPQPEYSQDHIVRRLISKFRKPSDAGAIGLPGTGSGSSNLLQVPQPTHGLPTISGQLAASSTAAAGGEGTSGTGQAGAADPAGSGMQHAATGASAIAGLQRSLAGKQSRWSQLVASAAAGAGAKSSTSQATGASGAGSSAAGSSAAGHHQPVSSTRSLLDISTDLPGGESSSNRSSADGRDDEVDENYFRPGGKGHQALLDNMDKR